MNRKQAYENHLDADKAKWFAVYTHYKREKLALKHLERKGISAYLPIQRKVRKYLRKIRTVELPLISCYVFVKITKKEYIKVLETEHVLSFVKFAKNLIAIPDEEMEWMKIILGEGINVNIEKSNFVEGDEIEIVTGNLAGLKGKLVNIKGKNQVLVDLTYIGYSLRIEVDRSLLRKYNQNVLIG